MNPIRAIAKTMLPRPVRNAIKYCISQDYRDRLSWEKDRQVGQWVFELTRGVVVGGPFAGLKYVSTARGSSIGPKLLGTYEKELHGAVGQIVARGYQTIVNIGAGEGYYAVGLASRIPGAKVICFDAEPYNQEQIRTLARLNGVESRIDVRGFCDDAALTSVLCGKDRALVVCDIEGGEVEVLRPEAVPGLKNADVLVELHDIIRKDCSPIVRERFAPTHTVEVFKSRPRRLGDFPPNLDVEAGRRLSAMDERRGRIPMNFFWMQVRQG